MWFPLSRCINTYYRPLRYPTILLRLFCLFWAHVTLLYQLLKPEPPAKLCEGLMFCSLRLQQRTGVLDC
jgi:hypothetical protein